MKIIKKTVKMQRFKKYILLFCMYKMIEISAKTFAKNCIQAISQLKN